MIDTLFLFLLITTFVINKNSKKMAFQIKFSVSVSADGKTVTLLDESNWDEPGYNRSDFVRTFLLTDFAGEEIESIELPVDSDTATYETDKDIWLNVLFTIAGAETFTELQSYGFDRIFVNKLQTLLLSNMFDCSPHSKMNTAVSFWQAALGIEQTGNAGAFQSDLDIANLYIDQA